MIVIDYESYPRLTLEQKRGIFSYGMSDAGGTFLSGEGPDFSSGPSASLMVRLGHPHADMVPLENFTIASRQTGYNHVKFDPWSPQVLIKTPLKKQALNVSKYRRDPN